jgi:hypothetical protein
MPTLEEAAAAGGCAGFIAWVVMPSLSLMVAIGGLHDGAVTTFECRRIQPRVVREELETNGDLTRPVERVVQEGRVDVTVTRRVLGLFPISRRTLQDVADADSFSGTSYTTRKATSRVTHSYDSGNVTLVTRSGEVYESPTIARALGPDPSTVRQRVEAYIGSGTIEPLTLRVVPWLSNIVAVPFVFVSLMFIGAWARRLSGSMVVGRQPPAATK